MIDSTRTLAAALCLAAGQVQAAPEDGDWQVALIDAAGTAHEVAALTVSDGRYEIAMNDAVFADYFLSMRPFKCLEGPEKLWCHVPYPYAIARDLGSGLTDLEYDLLFVWKRTGDYGIDLWNGVYYRIEEDGDRLVGRMHEIDLDALGVPPPEGEMRPIGPADLTEAEPGSHWLPNVVITRN